MRYSRVARIQLRDILPDGSDGRFYIRRCPDFSHLTSITLRVTTYPDAEVYTTHHIRIITAGEPQQRPAVAVAVVVAVA